MLVAYGPQSQKPWTRRERVSHGLLLVTFVLDSVEAFLHAEKHGMKAVATALGGKDLLFVAVCLLVIAASRWRSDRDAESDRRREGIRRVFQLLAVNAMLDMIVLLMTM